LKLTGGCYPSRRSAAVAFRQRANSCTASKSPRISTSFFARVQPFSFRFHDDGVGQQLEPLAPDQLYRPARFGPTAESTGIVLRDAMLEVELR
jgi:hypothetical protein